MAVKIRLQRHGRKARPFYHIVVADSRVKRDGRKIEKLGTYNPLTSPATIDLDFDRALVWLNNGAQPTNTVRSILSHEGVLLKKHLMGGVSKGAFDEAEMEKRFNQWVEGKDKEKQNTIEQNQKAEGEEKAARLAAEKEVAAARIPQVEEEVVAEEIAPEVENTTEATEAEAATDSEHTDAPATPEAEAPAAEEAK